MLTILIAATVAYLIADRMRRQDQLRRTVHANLTRGL
jgi:hypothetical protein